MDEAQSHSKRLFGAKQVLSYRKHFEVAKGRWSLSTSRAQHSCEPKAENHRKLLRVCEWEL